MICKRCGYNNLKPQRSSPQNKYYWGVVVQILSDETGYEKSEMHEIIKRKFLTEYRLVRGKKGQIYQYEITGNTSSLDSKQFEDVMSQIRMWASRDLSIFIPLPNENI